MDDRRSIIGFSASAAWIGLVAFLLFRDPVGVAKMTPNDWGSFLSGAFAPLGFLWLVLGYLQQGDDLKLSTKALLLQAEELKNSVEQQRALVEVSRLQIESEREALAAEQRQRLSEAKPHISLSSDGGAFRGDGHSAYTIKFSNSGDTACSLAAEMHYPLGRIQQLHTSAAYNRGDSHQATVEVDHPSQIDGATIKVRFNDRLGNAYIENYVVRRQGDHPHASLAISQVAA